MSDEPAAAPIPRSAEEGGYPPMPLMLASVGQEIELVSIRAGRNLQHRLAEMGFVPGARFRVLTKGRPGPFIISLKDTRLMLGHGMVPRICVRPA